MEEAVKKIDREEKKFDFRMAFMQSKTIDCFEKASQSEKKNYAPCKDATQKDMNRILNDFYESVKK